MPRWHHSDSSSERYQEVKSIETFYAAHISRSQAKSMFGNWTISGQVVKSVDISLPHLTIQASHCCVWCGFEPHTWHQTCKVLLAGVSGGQGASVFTPPVLLIGLSQMSCPMRKLDLCLCETKAKISFTVTISAFAFTSPIPLLLKSEISTVYPSS